ncbi:MAG: hypothetical protein ABW067_04290 [Rhizobacter sp.]|jgi:hypothetical protein
MYRLVLIVLMFVLPLQWSWAAPAGVCAHETATAEAVPEAFVAQADQATDETADAPSPHALHDCPHCQGASALCCRNDPTAARDWTGDRPTPTAPGFLPEPPVESFLRPPLRDV